MRANLLDRVQTALSKTATREAKRPICCLAILVFAHNFVKEQNRPRFQLCESRVRFLHLSGATLINGEHCRVPDPHSTLVTSGRKDRIGNLDHSAKSGSVSFQMDLLLH